MPFPSTLPQAGTKRFKQLLFTDIWLHIVRSSDDLHTDGNEQKLRVTVPVMIYVLVGVVHAERLVDGGALVHELYGASGVGRDVTDGQQPADRRTEGTSEQPAEPHCTNTTEDKRDAAAATLHTGTKLCLTAGLSPLLSARSHRLLVQHGE